MFTPVDQRLAKAVFVILSLFFLFSQAKAQCTAAMGANINPLEGCEVLTIQFNDLSTGVIQSRTWDFGDGSPTSGAQNPTHSYVAGTLSDTTYIVSLTIQCVTGPPSVVYDTVLVHKKPDVFFNAPTTTVCALSDSVCFNNLSDSGPGYTYLWNFGDFTSSTQAQPCKIYSTGGVYDVQLTVTNNFGCVNSYTINNYINVIPAPSPDFTISSLIGCTPMSVNFTNITDTITTSFSAWIWDFGDNSPQVPGFNPGTHVYVNPGTYIVTLGATNSLGCYNSTTRALVVHQTPDPSFTADSPICLSDSSLIAFTGAAGPLATYTWNFSGGTATPGTGQGPHYASWTTAGMQTITLSVTDSGCTATDTEQVLVYPSPVLSLTVSPNDTVCQGTPVIFTAAPGNYMNYKFFRNNTLVQSSSANTYQPATVNNGDQVYVIAIDYNGCESAASNVIQMAVNPVPVVSLNSTSPAVCTGDTIIFTAIPAGYDNYAFYDGNVILQTGTSNVYTYINPPDGHNITVVATENGCTGNASNMITISAVPLLLPPQVNCGTSTNSTIQFTWNAVMGASGYMVSVNNGPFVVPSSGSTGTSHNITGLSPGDTASIVVMAIASAPCADTSYSGTVECYAIPCTAITFNTSTQVSVCTGSQANLSVNSISTGSYAVSWDGGSFSGNTSYSFMPAGNDTVTVSVIDTLQPGCPAATMLVYVTVNSIPSVTLTNSTGNDTICAGSPVIFTASPNTYSTYSFYNGYSLVQAGASNVYTANALATGNSITVVASNSGCTDSSNAISIAVVSPMPAPQVNCGTTTNSSIQFTWNAVTGSTGYMVSVNGGPFITPSSGPNGLDHLVTGLNPGDAVTLTVTALGNGVCGNSSISLPASCFALPCTATTFNINTSYTICSGDSVVLTAANISASNYSISWNGGAATTVASYTVYPVNDTVITVEIADLDQPSCPPAVHYVTIDVNPLPSVTVTSSDADDIICQGDALTFTASPAGYSNYSFYDGFLLLQSSGNPVFTTGNWINGHTLTVVASDAGCTGPVSNSITTTVVAPLQVPQVNCSNTTSSSIEFIWNPVPGAGGYQVSINGGPYITPSSGNNGITHLITGLNPNDAVTITVIALGNAPCGNSAASLPQTCYAVPCNAVTFSISPYLSACSGDSAILSISSISSASYSISWNGGPATTSTSYTVVPTGDTVISVSVSDPAQPSCVPATNYFIIDVTPLPAVMLGSSAVNDSVCQGTPVVFTASPAGYDTYDFYVNNVLVQSSNYHVYTANSISNGSNIYVEATNQGCQSISNNMTITVVPLPVLSLTSSLPGDSVCYGDTIIFTASPSGLSNYTFSLGSAILQSSSSETLSISSLALGNSMISVTGTNAFGCTGGAASLTATVLPLPAVTLSCSDPNNTICSGDAITFTASPAGMNAYEFYIGATLVQNSSSNIYTTTQLANGNSISVVGINGNNCSSPGSNAIVITVNPLPDPVLTASDTGICAGSSATINVTLQGPVTSATYQWSTGATTSSINASPASSTTYYITATANGCSGQDSITILVDNTTPPVANAGVNATICIGDSIQLNATGGANYLWSPSTGLSDPAIANPKASPSSTTVYQVTVTNLYCLDNDNLTITIDLCLEDITGPIPQVITPNNDGSNDYLVIPDIDYFTENTLVIFNRWGNAVYNAAPYNNEWNGKSGTGKDLTDGVYYYILDLGNGSEPKTGYVMITR